MSKLLQEIEEAIHRLPRDEVFALNQWLQERGSLVISLNILEKRS